MLFGHEDPHQASVVKLTERMQTEDVVAHSPLRLLSQFDLSDQVADRRIRPGECNAGRFTDHAASAVAPDEIIRPQRFAARQLHVDASVVLREACHLASAIDRYGQFFDPLGQYAFTVPLPEGKPVVVPGWKITDVQRDVGERCNLHSFALREEAIGNPALIENLDSAGVQATRARADDLRARPPLDNGNVNARQC